VRLARLEVLVGAHESALGTERVAALVRALTELAAEER